MFLRLLEVVGAGGDSAARAEGLGGRVERKRRLRRLSVTRGLKGSWC